MKRPKLYRPGGPWLFGSPFVHEVWGWESPNCLDPNKENTNCVLPANLYAKLPGGHEHGGTRLYHSKDEARKAFRMARAALKNELKADQVRMP